MCSNLLSNHVREWELLLDSLSSQILDEFNACDEYEAIITLYKLRGIREIFEKWLSDLADESSEHDLLNKSKSLASSWRDKGNSYFKEGKLEECLKYYNFSVLSAPRDDETFPLALANRAAVLLEMGKYQESVRDAELALKEGYPQDQRAPKVLRRLQKARVLLQPAENYVAYIESLLPGAGRLPNPAFPGASSALDLRYSAERGRHVVTNRAVEQGEVLFVEKSFAFVALPGPGGVLPIVCETCCQPDIIPIPCTDCAGSIYCSEKCRVEGWSRFHRWECAGTRYLLWPSIGIAHLALRVFLIASQETFGDASRGMDGCSALQALDIVRKACLSPALCSSYRNIYNLLTNFQKMDKKDFIQYTLTGFMLTIYLKKHSDFFSGGGGGWCRSLQDGEAEVVTACLLTRHLGQLVSSGHAVAGMREADGNRQHARLATAIYPSASMMNHSCEPNIISSHYRELLIVKALSSLEPGQEVFNCYGPQYRRHAGALRRAQLLQQYCFLCDCTACRDPQKDNFVETFESYICDQCEGAVNKETLKCSSCGAIPEQGTGRSLRSVSQLVSSIRDEASSLEGQAAIKRILEVLKLQKMSQYKYNASLRETIDLLAHLYANEGIYDKSVQLLNSNLPAVKSQFGEHSVEVAYELEKLSDVMMAQIKFIGKDTSSVYFRDLCMKTKKVMSETLEIFNLISGPWSAPCREMKDKLSILEKLLLKI